MNTISQYCEKNKNILAIIQYGSSARGDHENCSDIDFFILLKNESQSDKSYIKNELIKQFKDKPLDISFYDTDRFELMVQHGSLFLWHLKIEGEIWSTSEYFDEQISNLSEFKGSIEDLLLYQKILSSTIFSIKNNGTNFYDLSILSTLARNTLILACYNIGKKEFGKLQVYQTLSQHYSEPLPLLYENYLELNEYRAFYSRKTPESSLPSNDKIEEYILDVKNLLDFTLKELNINNSLDRLANLIYSNIDKPLYTSFELNIEIERDFFLILKSLCKYYYNYNLCGLSTLHLNSLNEYVKKQSYSPNQLIQQGLTLYEVYKELKKDTSIYEPDKENLFQLSKKINDETLPVGRLSNYLLKKKNTYLIAKLRKFKFFNKIINFIENNNKVYNFSKDLQCFSKSANETIQMLMLK